MYFFTNKGKLSTLCIPLLLLALALVILPANSAKAEVVYPKDELITEYLQIDSPIVIKFDKVIQWDTSIITEPDTPKDNHNGIQLFNLEDKSEVPVSFKMEIDGNSLRIIPEPALEPDKDYILKITKDIVREKDVTSDGGESGYVFKDKELSEDETYEFGTYSLTFYDLMSEEEDSMDDLIANFLPRQMMVTAPTRYIDRMEVIHRKEGVMQETTSRSVTNIEITIDDAAIDNENGDVARIEVNADYGTGEAEKKHLNLVANKGRSTHTFAFSGLPDNGYDIEVTVYRDNDGGEDNILDKQIIKVPSEDKTTITSSFRDTTRMAGKTFSLYELINRESNMQKLLDENKMEDLTVQVVEE